MIMQILFQNFSGKMDFIVWPKIVWPDQCLKLGFNEKPNYEKFHFRETLLLKQIRARSTQELSLTTLQLFVFSRGS